MDEEGGRLPVVAKIEKPQAVENLKSIIDAFDAIMVARGDLGVEMPLEQVPIVQKRAVRARPPLGQARHRRDPGARVDDREPAPHARRGQRLRQRDPRRSRRRYALGRDQRPADYPIVTIETMARIINATEAKGIKRIPPLGTQPRTQGGAITLAALDVAEFVEAKAIIVFTEFPATQHAACRVCVPKIPMFGFTPSPEIECRMQMNWGVNTRLVDRVDHTDDMVAQVDDILIGERLVAKGEKVVVVSGMPPGIPGSTNDIRVHTVGDVHDEAAPAYHGKRRIEIQHTGAIPIIKPSEG